MKKKIKDLTLGKAKLICNIQQSCIDCPLRNPSYLSMCYLDILQAKKDYENFDLEKEVEIDE